MAGTGPGGRVPPHLIDTPADPRFQHIKSVSTEMPPPPQRDAKFSDFKGENAMHQAVEARAFKGIKAALQQHCFNATEQWNLATILNAYQQKFARNLQSLQPYAGNVPAELIQAQEQDQKLIQEILDLLNMDDDDDCFAQAMLALQNS